MSDKKDMEQLITPLRNNILCKIIVEEKKSGIILSESAKESESSKFLFARKLGPDVESVKIGDKLLLNPISCMSNIVKVDDNYWVIPESEIVAVER